MYETFSFLYIEEGGMTKVVTKPRRNGYWLPLKDPEEDKQEVSLADAKKISVNAAAEELDRTHNQ